MKRSRYYFNDEQNVLAECRNIMFSHRLDHLPNGEELSIMGYGALEAAILKHHGGFRRVRTLLGEAQRKREDGSLNTEEKVIQVVKQIMADNKLLRAPTQKELRQFGHEGIVPAIHRELGGFVKLRLALGEKPLRKRGMWTKDYVLEQARNVISSNNLTTFPTQGYLVSIGRTDLLSAIETVYGGLTKFREVLGEVTDIRPNGALQNRDYVISEVKRIMREHNLSTIPSKTQLSEFGESSISVAISKNHGGFTNLRKLMGEEDVRIENGQWRDINYVISEAIGVLTINGLEQLPSCKELRKMGHASLASSISKYHGGFHKFRGMLGGEQGTEKGVWKNRDFVVSKINAVMQENGLDEIPSAYRLVKLGHAQIVAAIHLHHGGMRAFKTSLGGTSKVTDGTWKNLDYVLERAEVFLQSHPEYENLPTHDKLVNHGEGPLSRAIVKYHGGYNNFREILAQRLDRVHSSSTSILEGYVST